MHRPVARLVLLVVLLLPCAISAPALAAPGSAAPAPSMPSDLFLDWWSGWTNGSAVPGGDFFRIGLDPETGEWGRAPAEQALEVSGLMAQPLVFHRADGSIEVILDPRIVDYLVARLGPNGHPAFDCVPTDALGPALSGSAGSGPPDR